MIFLAISWSQFIGVNVRFGKDPNIWVMVSHEVVGWNAKVVVASDQHVTLCFTYQGVSCFLTCIYASTAYFKRRSLWDSLRTLSLNNEPWLVIRDFNFVLGAHENIGGGGASPSSTSL